MTVLDLLTELSDMQLDEFYSWLETQNRIDPSLFHGPFAVEPTVDDLLAWHRDEPDLVEALCEERRVELTS